MDRAVWLESKQEIAIREDCGLLAYSPLAFGMLSGKYEGGARPAHGRARRAGAPRSPRRRGREGHGMGCPRQSARAPDDARALASRRLLYGATTLALVVVLVLGVVLYVAYRRQQEQEPGQHREHEARRSGDGRAWCAGAVDVGHGVLFGM